MELSSCPQSLPRKGPCDAEKRVFEGKLDILRRKLIIVNFVSSMNALAKLKFLARVVNQSIAIKR